MLKKNIKKNITATRPSPQVATIGAVSTRTGAVSAKSDASTLAMEAVTTLFFCTP